MVCVELTLQETLMANRCLAASLQCGMLAAEDSINADLLLHRVASQQIKIALPILPFSSQSARGGQQPERIGRAQRLGASAAGAATAAEPLGACQVREAEVEDVEARPQDGNGGV